MPGLETPAAALPGIGLRVGFVGAGFMGRVHSRAARAAGATLAGIVGSIPERGEAAARELGIERAYPDLDALLADSTIDVVHVLTPNALHLEQTLAVLAAGKHVVCEKPLATTPADARVLVDAVDTVGAGAAGIATAEVPGTAVPAAAGSRGRVATVPFAYRYNPLVREARARVASGEFGRLLTIEGVYLQDWLFHESDSNWRVDAASGGASRAFSDIGSHLVDLLEFVTGDRVERLAALTRTFAASRPGYPQVATEDAVALTLATRGGAIGTLLVTQMAAGRKNRLRLEIHGSAESFVFNQEQPETLWIGRASGTQLLPRDDAQLAPDAARLVTVPAGHPQGYQDAFNAFVADSYAAVRGGEPEGLPRFADGARAADVVDAVMRSARDGTWVPV